MDNPLPETVSALYLVPTFHYDVAYLKTHEGYMPESLRILDTALDLLDRHPEYRFMVEQVILLEAWWDRRPEKRDTLVRHAREGRLSAAPGMYVMPDLNHCDGESLYRQALLGRRWLEETLGLRPEVCWIADCWGHHAQLPQILAQCGYRYYAFWRCMRRDVMRTRFLWEGLDGTRLRAHWLRRGYGNLLFPGPESLQNEGDQSWARGSRDQIRKVCDDLLAVEPLPALLLCNGGDFLQPQPSAPESVRRLNAAGGLPPIRFASAADYLGSLDWTAAPVFGGEFNSALQGTFTSHIRIKQRNRELVRRLLALESRLAVTGAAGADLAPVWKLLLKQQFHDIICGTITDDAVRDSLAEFDEAEKRITEAAHSPAGEPAYFNALAFPRTTIVEQDRKRIRLDLPPLGFAAAAQATALPAAETVPLPLTFQTPWYRATIGPDGYLTSLIDAGSGLERIRPEPAPFGSLGMQMDYGDFWLNFEAPLSGGSLASTLTQNNPDPFDRSVRDGITVRSTFLPRILAVRAIRCGDEEVEVVQEGLLQFWRLQVRFTTTLRLSKHHPRIEYETRIEPSGKHYRIRAAFPTTIADGRILHEIPFGLQERGPHEHAAQHWMACLGGDGGLAVLNEGTPGNNADGGILMLTLFRSVAMEYKAPSESGFQEGVPHVFRYAVTPAHPERLEEVVRQGLLFNSPPLPCALPSGVRPDAWRLEGDGNVILSSLRRDGTGVLVRLYECAGRAGKAVLRPPAWVTRAAPADGLDQETGTTSAVNGGLAIELGPFQIRQLRLM